jgi:class 3 adenylate cyclase/tetratricopeptide (TPR) repeat protein
MESSDLCRECRAPVQVGARFCAACGQAIGIATSENERRHLTLLFCDLADSTALSERLDPEDLHDLLTSYQRVCQDVIRQYQGHISQFLGDGVMSYFGYPIAQEDDAILATRAALRIVEDVKAINQGIGRRLQAEVHVRVGLHTGIAVVGDVGQGGARDRLAVGESVNLAARIQTFASVDTVLVSASTARLIDGYFELQSLDTQVLKGFTRPVELFRVVRPTGARTKIEATARGRLTPHVGRERQLDDLTTAWRDVKDGADRIVVVRGEAGIGKSRIVHHFRHTTLAEGAVVLECFCSPLAQATAFAPIAEMLDGRVVDRAHGETTAPKKLEALASLLGEHSRFGSDALPLMAALLSIGGADETAIRELSPVRRRARTLEIMREWMASSAERLPLAILVEDLHWADPSTLEFLDLLVQKNLGGRTLLCMTYRPEFTRWEKEQKEDRVKAIELGRLNAKEVEAMVTHVAGGHALPPLVARRIAERSDGVPLYVEEVTKAVLESGALQIDANRYELAGPLDERYLPSTVRGSLIARFDRLGESRSVAQLGAAIGREFSYQLISAVSVTGDAELREHLDRLSRSELVFVHGEPPAAVYTFKHALIQDAIYATLLKSDRARVHERIFAALQEKFPEVVAARPEMAAYHAENGGRREAAVPLLRDAGMRALGRAAVAEAVKHLAHGIDLVDVLDEPNRTTMEIELHAAIGPAYMATVGWAAPEVERSSARLRDLATAKGDGARLYQAMWGLWTVDFVRGWLGPALDIARRVHEMAQQTGIPMFRVTGHHAVGYTHFYRGEYEECLRHAQDGLALFDLDQEKQLASTFQLSSSCALWCYRAEALQMLGRTQEATQCILELRKLLDALDHAPSRAYSLSMQCFFFHAKDDVEEVHRLATEVRALSLVEGFALWVTVADLFLAWADARRGGNAAHAVEKIRAAKAHYDGTLTHITEIELSSMLAETLLLANRPEEVSPTVQAALQIARPGMASHYEADLLRLQGDAAKVMGDRSRATVFYQRAVESARRVGAKTLESRSAAALQRSEEAQPTVPSWP